MTNNSSLSTILGDGFEKLPFEQQRDAILTWFKSQPQAEQDRISSGFGVYELVHEDELTFALVLNRPLNYEWVAIRMRTGEWTIANEDSGSRDSKKVYADIRVIEEEILEQFPHIRAYDWSYQSQIRGYKFTDQEAMVFKLKFCGEQLEDC